MYNNIMIRPGDILKSLYNGEHCVVGFVSEDGAVAYGYRLRDRKEQRMPLSNYMLVYSCNEEISNVGN